MSLNRIAINMSHLFDIHCKELVNKTISVSDIGRRIVVGSEVIKLTNDNIDTYNGQNYDVINALAHSFDNVPVYCTEYMLQEEAGRRIGTSTEFSLQIIPNVSISNDMTDGSILKYQGGYWVNVPIDNIRSVIVADTVIQKTGDNIVLSICNTTNRGMVKFASVNDTTSTNLAAGPANIVNTAKSGLNPVLCVGSNIPYAKYYLDSNSSKIYQCGSPAIDVTLGAHVVNFLPITGYRTPVSKSINIENRENKVVVFGEYVAESFNLRVFSSDRNMTWTTDGWVTFHSATDIVNLPAAVYSIECSTGDIVNITLNKDTIVSVY